MIKNKNSTKYYSTQMEDRVAGIIGGYRDRASGAGLFEKSDVINKAASLSCECKCSMKDKSSISIKKEWLDKHHQDCFNMRIMNEALAVDFGPNSEIYFIISKKLMKYIVEKLLEDNK